MNKKAHRCCFTGHRPEKLILSEAEIKSLLEKAIDTAVQNGFTTFISGMAPGVDIWAAETVLAKKKSNNTIRLICAVPYPDFGVKRSFAEMQRYDRIIENSDYIKYVSTHYFPGCYQVRNEYMVDRSSLVIALFNGQNSGTKNTVDYASSKGIKVINLLKQP